MPLLRLIMLLVAAVGTGIGVIVVVSTLLAVGWLATAAVVAPIIAAVWALGWLRDLSVRLLRNRPAASSERSGCHRR